MQPLPKKKSVLKALLAIMLLAPVCTISAQIKALTESGKEVTLYDNGTWKYADSTNDPVFTADSLKTNPAVFTKSTRATFLVKSNVTNVGVYINPAKWTFAAHRDNEVNPEYRFTAKSGEGMAMLVTEKTGVSLDFIMDVVLRNAQQAAADAKIVSAEYRMVNNKKVICMQITGTIKGLAFVYLGYYYSGENGTVQLLTYSSKKLFDSERKELEEFLNGFTEIVK